MTRDRTPDSHDFPTRRYDLVKEFVITLVVVLVASLGLAAIFSSPDEKPITMSAWANADPNNLVTTAASELAGTTTSATYGAPYNSNSEGQKLGPIPLQKWGGVRIPIDSADLVLGPLSNTTNDPAVSSAVAAWKAAAAQQTKWAADYVDAIGAAAADGEAATGAGGDPANVAAGDYGPVPALSAGLLALAKTGGLEGALDSAGNFYGGDTTKSWLRRADGAYLEDQAVAQNLAGDQWGMMNEVGNAPGQPWMWLYTFWYQIKPFSTSDNADVEVWALMMLLTLLLMFLPFIPGLRTIPRWIPVHRLIWRNYYRRSAGRP
ncbi:MAG: hypothetical protein HHJ13_15635, partial [Phycicoccus sp.]|nr:hypothetical protein [Phycicoccus sp.]